jgi:hypothetical protein
MQALFKNQPSIVQVRGLMEARIVNAYDLVFSIRATAGTECKTVIELTLEHHENRLPQKT